MAARTRESRTPRPAICCETVRSSGARSRSSAGSEATKKSAATTRNALYFRELHGLELRSPEHAAAEAAVGKLRSRVDPSRASSGSFPTVLLPEDQSVLRYRRTSSCVPSRTNVISPLSSVKTIRKPRPKRASQIPLEWSFRIPRPTWVWGFPIAPGRSRITWNVDARSSAASSRADRWNASVRDTRISGYDCYAMSHFFGRAASSEPRLLPASRVGRRPPPGN